MSNDGTEDYSTSTLECPTAHPLFHNLSHGQETAMVIVMFVFVGGMTFRLLQFYDAVEKTNNSGSPPIWWSYLVKTWPFMGVMLYVPLGIYGHFGPEKQGNMCIVPPNGTWGWWYVPGSVEFHVWWTGIVEVAGGAALTLAGMLEGSQSWARPLRKVSALTLLICTVCMTFANCYIVTHGAFMTELDAPLPMWVQVTRFAVQALWLSNLAYLASRDKLGVANSAPADTKVD